MNGPVAAAVGALVGLVLMAAVAAVVEYARRPRWDDDDETNVLPRMGKALR